MLEAVVRQGFRRNGDGAVPGLSQTEYESLRIAAVEPDGYEGSRAGRRFWIGPLSTVTGIAPVQATPTTAAQWALFNNDTIKTYALEELGMMLPSGTAGAGAVLLGTLFQLPAQTAPATGYTVVQNADPASSITSKMVVKSAVTLTAPATNLWFPIAKNDSTNTAVGSVAIENRNVRGRILLPPQWGLGLAVVGPAGTTPLFAPFASWLEFVAALDV